MDRKVEKVLRSILKKAKTVTFIKNVCEKMDRCIKAAGTRGGIPIPFWLMLGTFGGAWRFSLQNALAGLALTQSHFDGRCAREQASWGAPTPRSSGRFPGTVGQSRGCRTRRRSRHASNRRS
eukprot:8278-Prymnesium_polylepis.1